ncbi:hypothetical protein PC110_g22585 [Phytophthora cactorum]|uniref:Gag protein n=1 Tax=Phytophthora cactorum TaxID=29920 RepID=A0A329RBZ4_9STRA|nr:hypothetical protein PC110_g22585 [Phytophthora cactorum]
MDLAVKFEDFDNSEQFIVLEMDKYDLILGVPWLEKHEPWIEWRGKAIGASPAVSDRALPCVGSPQSPPESRPVDEVSKVSAPGNAGQVGGQGPQTVAQILTEEEDAERASCVGNSVPHGAVSPPDVTIETSHDVGNEVPQMFAVDDAVDDTVAIASRV